MGKSHLRIALGDRCPLVWLAGEHHEFVGVFWGIMFRQAFIGVWWRTKKPQRKD